MTLSASLTGFQVEFIDAVKGDEFSDKARPPVCIPFAALFLTANVGTQGVNLKEGALGSWRSHLNAIRRFV